MCAFLIPQVENSITTNTVLDGVTVTGGNADGSSPNDSGRGYTVMVEAAEKCSPQIMDATFTGNSADFGGAIFNYGLEAESSLQITNAILWENTASAVR